MRPAAVPGVQRGRNECVADSTSRLSDQANAWVQSVKRALGCLNTVRDVGMDGATRLVDGSAGPGYEYGRLEIFARGFWSNICNYDRFTPDSTQVACRALGYDGGAALRFTQPYASTLNKVLHCHVLESSSMQSGVRVCMH